MHELSICASIAAIAENHRGHRTVVSVRVRIGHLRQVVPEALTLGWAATVRDTPLAGAILDVEAVPAEIVCADCRQHSQLDEPFLLCPACGGDAVTVVAGEECLVASVDLVDPPTIPDEVE